MKIKLSLIIMLLGLMMNITCVAEDKFTTMIISIDIGSDVMYIDEMPVNIEKPYVTDNGIVMVPVRGIAESLGADVIWEDGDIFVEYPREAEYSELCYSIDSYTVDKNRIISYEMPEKAILNENGVTMVPLESIADFFGAEIKQKNKDNIIIQRKIYSTQGKEYITCSEYGWNMILPKEKISSFYCDEGYEEVSFDAEGDLFIISVFDLKNNRANRNISEFYIWESPFKADCSQDKYYELLLSSMVGKYSKAEKCTNINGDEYIRFESHEEGYMLEYIYLKNDKLYEIYSITGDYYKSAYYEEIMKTFFPEVRSGDNVIDLTEVNNITNLVYN